MLETTHNGRDQRRMTGPERSMLYRMALETGFRSTELAVLLVSSIDFENMTVILPPELTKNRKDAFLPLRKDLIERLKAFVAGKSPQSPIFPTMPRVEAVADMLKADLLDAGINPEDDGMGKLDFHSLRHSFATLLAQAGVDVKTAQSLMRHSTPTLTLGIYTHMVRGSDRTAIDRLPVFASKPKTEVLKATGTDGRTVQITTGTLTNQLTKTTDLEGHFVASACNNDTVSIQDEDKEKTPSMGSKTGF